MTATDRPQVCAYCHRPLVADFRFCGYCGHEVVEASSIATEESTHQPQTPLQVIPRRSGRGRLLVGAALLLASWVTITVFNSGGTSNPTGPASVVQKAGGTSSDPATTPTELIRRAEEALKPESTTVEISEALHMLQSIPETAPESARAKTVKQALLKTQQARKLARDRAREQAMSGMVKKRDEMRGLTVWRDHSMPAFVNSRSWVGSYIMVPDTGEPFLRFVIYYAAHDWLFIQNYRFKIDGQTFMLTPSQFGNDAVKTDSGELADGSVGIWEWWDVLAEKGALTVLRSLSDSKDASLRFEGRQYYKDRVIGAEERAATKRTLAAFEALGGDSELHSNAKP